MKWQKKTNDFFNKSRCFSEKQHEARVKTFLFDFAKDDYEKLRLYIADIDVGFVGE